MRSVYNFSAGETNFSLKQIKINLIYGDTSHPMIDSEVKLELYPIPRVYICGSSLLPFTGFEDISSIPHDEDGRQIPGFFANINGPLWGNKKWKWLVSQTPFLATGNKETKILNAKFHLFNFANFHYCGQATGDQKAKKIQVDANGKRVDHKEKTSSQLFLVDTLALNWDTWQIEIDATPTTAKDTEYIKKNGGYRLTHVGSIQNTNGTFTGEELEKCLDAIEAFFSFAMGTWCCPVCTVGYDDSENIVWEQWNAPKQYHEKPSNWFHENAQHLAQLFPLFMGKYYDPDWIMVFQNIIYWYVEANRKIGSISLVLSQIALERLAYTREGKNSNKSCASQKIRTLFKSLKLPTEIPPDCPNLQEEARANGWTDFAHSLIELRNDIVHPRKKYDRKNDMMWFEGAFLGLWYVELCILAICKYDGYYKNRLKRNCFHGQCEKLPWIP